LVKKIWLLNFKFFSENLIIDFLITIALSINFTCGFVLTMILKTDIAYLLLISFSSSLFAGILFKSLAKGIICACVSIILSLILSVTLFSLPVLSEGVFIFAALYPLLRLIIFVIFLSILGIIFGHLIGSYFA